MAAASELAGRAAALQMRESAVLLILLVLFLSSAAHDAAEKQLKKFARQVLCRADKIPYYHEPNDHVLTLSGRQFRLSY